MVRNVMQSKKMCSKKDKKMDYGKKSSKPQSMKNKPNYKTKK